MTLQWLCKYLHKFSAIAYKKKKYFRKTSKFAFASIFISYSLYFRNYTQEFEHFIVIILHYEVIEILIKHNNFFFVNKLTEFFCNNGFDFFRFLF